MTKLANFAICLLLLHSSVAQNLNKDAVDRSRIQTSSYERSCTDEVEELRIELQEHNFQLEQSAKQTTILQAKVKELNAALKQRDTHVAELSKNLNNLVSLGSNCTQHAFALQRETEVLRLTTQAARATCQNAGANIELVHLDTGRYYFSSKKLNWYEAMKFCRFHGLDFATIETEKENTALVQKALELGLPNQHRYYLSGTDLGQEGQWFWSSTGQDIFFSAWFPSQPDNYNKNQHCLTMWNINGTIKWDDEVCDSKLLFICEAPQFCLDNNKL